jgi:hypothetical protein
MNFIVTAVFTLSHRFIHSNIINSKFNYPDIIFNFYLDFTVN